MIKYEDSNSKIYCDDNILLMNGLDDGCIDLTVTSPPYDDMRSYNGFVFDFENVAKELYRITKEGGVVVWVVADGTLNGSESGTSFKQALYFKEIGFNIHDTMIWEKAPRGAIGSNLCYWQTFEYMFVFSKGKIKTTNLIEDRKNVATGTITFGAGFVDGIAKYKRQGEMKEFGRRGNVWKIQRDSDKIHKAVFPDELANDHILSWSNEGDTVFEPFLGSGTTGKMAVINNRKFIGVDCSEEYVNIAIEKIRNARPIVRLPL
jgi:site-specific DNA-methyltransferase (adenine-specific)